MRAKTVKYERVKNLGNYETERVGVEVELVEGEKAFEAVHRARQFVDLVLNHRMSPALDAMKQTFSVIHSLVQSRRERGEDVTDLLSILEQMVLPQTF